MRCMVHLSTVLICTIYICYCYRSWLSSTDTAPNFQFLYLKWHIHFAVCLFVCLLCTLFLCKDQKIKRLRINFCVCEIHIKIGNKYYDDDHQHHSRPRGTSQALAMLNAKLPTRFVKFRNERNANDTKKNNNNNNNNSKAWRLEDFYLVVRRVQIRIVRSTYLWRDLNYIFAYANTK